MKETFGTDIGNWLMIGFHLVIDMYMYDSYLCKRLFTIFLSFSVSTLFQRRIGLYETYLFSLYTNVIVTKDVCMYFLFFFKFFSTACTRYPIKQSKPFEILYFHISFTKDTRKRRKKHVNALLHPNTVIKYCPLVWLFTTIFLQLKEWGIANGDTFFRRIVRFVMLQSETNADTSS